MLYKPLKFFTIYIIFTVFLSFFGPTIYYEYDKIPVFLYMVAFIIIFSLFYLIGIEYGNKGKPRVINKRLDNNVLRFIKISILITFLLSIGSFIDYVANYGFNIKNLGQAYIDLYSGYERNSGRSYSLLELSSMFTGIFKQASLVLGVLYYKRLDRKWRMLLWFSWGLLIFSSLILTGKQKILGDLIIYLLSIFLIFDRKINKKINKKYYKYILLAGLIVGFLFIYIQKQRYNIAGINLFNYNSKSTHHVNMNPEHIIFKIFGYEWGYPIAILLTTYLSGGYYGLSLCLKLPFVWTYGFGHSYSLSVIANRFLGLPFFFEDVYVIRMEERFGWPAMSKWHTIFPYFASDLTFIGTLFFFGFIAYIYAISYVESLKFKNPVSVLLFATLNILLLFVPANNQLMIGPEGYFAFLIIFFYWLLFHKRYNYKIEEN